MGRLVTPRQRASWGLDIGDYTLNLVKLLRKDGQPIIVEQDQYEYPLNLSRSDACPKQLVSDAMAIMLNRHVIDPKDEITLGMPSHLCLHRQFVLPPLAASKASEVVKFEVRQQVPFPLDEVFYDTQLISGTDQEGFLMYGEYAVTAVKQDHVFDRLQWLNGLKITGLQSTTTAIFNAACEDLQSDSNADQVTVIVSVGGDTTEMIVVKLGNKPKLLWQRNIPLAGRHWTQQIAKDCKLTFAKAEHLKRNLADSNVEDKAAMTNAVTMDLLLEIQRSLGFYYKIDNLLPPSRLLFVGSPITAEVFDVLQRNLKGEFTGGNEPKDQTVAQVDMWKPKSFQGEFITAYGLALRGLGAAVLNLNLIPPPKPLIDWKKIIRRLRVMKFRSPITFE